MHICQVLFRKSAPVTEHYKKAKQQKQLQRLQEKNQHLRIRGIKFLYNSANDPVSLNRTIKQQ